MPLTFNGVTIPENVANALSFNGVDITDVFFNGVQVWDQSLFSRVWSNGSLATVLSATLGFNVSGSTFRAQSYNNGVVYGNWVDVDSNGVFSGDSLTTSIDILTGDGTKFYSSAETGSTISFSPSAGFVGVGGSSQTLKFETSGGLIRASYGTDRGAWASLI